MKKIILIVFVLTGMSAKAQYFQYLYGSTRNQFLSDGHNTYNSGTGHFLVGPSEFIFNPFVRNMIDVQKTDINGSTTAPGTFNIHYEVTDMPNPPTSNPNLVTHEVHSIELSDGSGFAVAGSYSGGNVGPAPTTYGIYFHLMDNMGNPQPPFTTYGYTLPGNYIGIQLQSVIEAMNGNYIMIGYAIDATTRWNKAFAIEINKMGTVIWDQVYDLTSGSTMESDIPNSIVASPYLHPTHNLNEYWIVGEHTDFTTGVPSTDAFILRIDAANGNMLNNNIFYGFPHSKDVFTGIVPSANPNIDPNGEGFVVSGYTNENGHYDVWSIALDNSQNVAWTNKYNYMNAGMPTMNNDYCNDLMERINTSGLSEYYLVGYTDDGVKGTDDVLVFKIDDMGSLVPNGQFTYGDLDVDRGIRIDKLEGDPTADGIAIYAQSFHLNPTIGGWDHYLIKAYFNGVTACKDDQQDGEEQPGPQELFQDYGDNAENFTPYDMLISDYQPLSEQSVCFATSVTGGNNALKAPGNEGSVSPNPFTVGTTYASLELEVDEPTAVTVTVYDMLGRNYYTQNFNLIKGKNNLSLDISEAKMATGMYSVRISSEKLNQSIMLMVK